MIIEKTHIKMDFDPGIAKEIGVEEAIMLSNIEYWCEFNKAREIEIPLADRKHFKDGKWWTYNSATGFERLFNFWTKRQIERILKNLKNSGYVDSRNNLNEYKYDKTSWWTAKRINVDSMNTEKDIDIRKRVYGRTQNVEPIPDNKHRYINTDNKLEEQPQKNAVAAPESASINSLLQEFETINPTLNYGNTTERDSCKRLVKKYGVEKVRNCIRVAISVQGRPYSPVITTPYQLEKNLGKLLVFMKREEHQSLVESIPVFSSPSV